MCIWWSERDKQRDIRVTKNTTSTIILKLWVEKNDTKGFSAVLVSTGTPESCNKMLTESTIGIYIRFKMAAKTH